ncbi:NifB/NifX family molybdenum-iron cluster-binding protein [Spirochaeta lutea]|uniref:NifB/NifX family molybdenum-iron cluster-binding protein n=1 Tax=Spirochaeta lutea TaxID=1480694 RepID=UPI00068FCFEE|nr:NifB/NifX family molybdenum-iron cluster-binding protein [Spirochaeta lutea]
MIIAIPTQTNEGRSAPLSLHYGHSPYFAVYNSETNELAFITKPAHSQHHGGGCAPVEDLQAAGAQKVICKGLGQGAYARLQAAGLSVECVDGSITTLDDLIQALSGGTLQTLEDPALCSHHHGGGHDHDHGHHHHT